MFSTKRFKSSSVYNQEENQPPKHLKDSLSYIGSSFFNSRMRSMDVMNTKEQKLFGLMTHYEGNNFCWIQPTRTKNMQPCIEYAKYMKLVCLKSKAMKLQPLPEIRKGTDCLARYEVDRRWYRAIVVDDPVDDHWLVLFIDYGNMQRTLCGYMALPVEEPGNTFYDAPCQAVCCRLYNIVPRLPSLRDDIDRKLETYFTANPERFYEVIVRNVRSDYIADVDLFFNKAKLTGPNRLHRCHIGQELVDNQLATFACPKSAYSVLLNVSSQEHKAAATTEVSSRDQKTSDPDKIITGETKLMEPWISKATGSLNPVSTFKVKVEPMHPPEAFC